MENILKFIKEFSNFGEQVVKCFTCGNCYYFAVILMDRYKAEYLNEAEIVYDDIAGHFAARLGNKIYDITGDVTDKANWIPWNQLWKEDPVHAARIVLGCIKK